jgi:tetratricopeptide (TPR) repeat protein
MNSAAVYFLLARDTEAFSAIAQAELLFPENANLHLLKAQLLAANRREGEAEEEFLRAIRARPSDAAWFSLALLYNSQKRFAEALKCIQEAITYSTPFERWRLGLLYVSMGETSKALAAFDRAKRTSSFDSSSVAGRDFSARLAVACARAYRAANDLPNAVREQERASQLTPNNPTVWAGLAQLYEGRATRPKRRPRRPRPTVCNRARLLRPHHHPERTVNFSAIVADAEPRTISFLTSLRVVIVL